MGWEKTSNLPRAHWGPRAMPGKQRDSDSILTPCPPTRPLVRRGHRSPHTHSSWQSFPCPHRGLQDAWWSGEVWTELSSISQCLNIPRLCLGGVRERSCFFFLSPPHPGHRVSQGSGNRGDGPAPPTPQARPRRVRKARDRLPTSSWRRQWLSHRVKRGSSLSWPHTDSRSIRKVNTAVWRHSICTLSSFPGSQAPLGFTSIRGWFSTGEIGKGWGESEEGGKEGIEFSKRELWLFGKPSFAGRASPSSSCCFDIRYRFMSSVGKHETRKGQILTPSRQGKHWPSPGSAII